MNEPVEGFAPPPPAPEPPRLVRSGTLARMFGRLFLLQAAWNYERMQGLGFAYALAPAVRATKENDVEAAKALVPQVAYFNTHPVMASVAVGVVADQVDRRARGLDALDDAGLVRVKQALGSSLAAMGDPFFWGTVRPLVALVAVYGWREESSWLGAAVIVLGYNAIAIGYRIRGLFEGFRRGLPYVAQLPKRMSRLTETLRLFAVVLCALVCSTLLVPSVDATPKKVLAGGLGLLAGGLAFGLGRLGPGEWGLVLVLSLLAWVTIGPGF